MTAGVAPDGMDEAVVIHMHHAGQGAVVQEEIHGDKGRPDFIHHEPHHPGKAEIIGKGDVAAEEIGHFLLKSFSQVCFIGKYKVSIDGA